jgi:6-phosphogluconolactonase
MPTTPQIPHPIKREPPIEIEIVKDANALTDAAARTIRDLAHDAIGRHGAFCIAFSSDVPVELYERLADDRIDWHRTHVFWADERAASSADLAGTNFARARDALLTRVPLAAGNVHRIESEDVDLDHAARRYDDELRDVLGCCEVPRLHLVVLGLGADGRLASLVPRSSALDESHRLFVSTWLDSEHEARITMTARALSHAEHVLVLASGADVADALNEALYAPRDARRIPAHAIAKGPTVVRFLADEAAARELTKRR